MTFSLDKTRVLRGLRAGAAGLLAYGLLIPATAIHAAPAAGTGTLVGNVTCGADEATPASNIVVVAEGLNLETHTDDAGRFRLVGVPAGHALTVDAVAEASASRFNIVVQSGEVLDIGSIDVPICPQPSTLPSDAQTQQEQYRETPDQ